VSEPWVLAIDTATSRVVVAAGRTSGELVAERSFPAEHRHGERLLATIDALRRETGLELASLAGIVVGTGPGAFTGLRVGLATAKTLAHELGVPIAGVSSGEALLAACDGSLRLLLPAGANDRVEVRPGDAPRLLPSSGELADSGVTADVGAGGVGELAVDLDGRASGPALERGSKALDGLAAALLRLGAARLATGSDDPERLVPEYVTLPRGVLGSLDIEGGVSWSRGRP
jgi:tRNA threonylcarbamoyl adenosine modification protein YeaZ